MISWFTGVTEYRVKNPLSLFKNSFIFQNIRFSFFLYKKDKLLYTSYIAIFLISIYSNLFFNNSQDFFLKFL